MNEEFWEPNTTLETWLKINPKINKLLPVFCSCKKELEVVPCISKNWIGVKQKTECPCGEIYPLYRILPRNHDEAMKSILEMKNDISPKIN